MLDHRLLLISLLALFLALNTVPSLFESPAAASSPSRLVPIEVEPDVTIPGEREES
jgi:hypothetical protein